MTDDELDTWGGITQYIQENGRVMECDAYRLFGDEWTRVSLNADDRREFDSLDDVPEDWDLVGVAENHPEATKADQLDRRVSAVFAPFHAHEWGTLRLKRATVEVQQ